MLQVMRRGRAEDLRRLTREEDMALRQAFGWFAVAAARPIGIRVVREHQTARGGHWFVCDCLGGPGPAPVLVPVAKTHVRRHVERPWPEHADWCDFCREAAEQQVISAPVRRPSLDTHLRLVRAFGSEQARERVLKRVSDGHARGRLATLLLTLLSDAGLTRIVAGRGRSVAEQFAAIRKAAGAIELDAGVPLSRFLCAFPAALPEFVRRLSALPAGVFRRSGRPHGVLIGVAAEASGGRIVPVRGEPFEVAGGTSIFGEVDDIPRGVAYVLESVPLT